MFCTSARRWSGIFLRKERERAGRRTRRSRARKEMPRAVSRYNPLLRYYRIILKRGPRTVGPLHLPPPARSRRDRHSARTRGTRVKISPVMHGKFGTVGSLCRGRSMQIRHEISLIVVCRMTEPGNRPFCGSGSDRPKTATRRRCRSIDGDGGCGSDRCRADQAL